MNDLSKFNGCNKIVCIKSGFGYEIGKIYKLEFNNDYFKITIDNIRSASYGINNDGSNFDVNCKKLILDTFITIAEHRKLIINDLID